MSQIRGVNLGVGPTDPYRVYGDEVETGVVPSWVSNNELTSSLAFSASSGCACGGGNVALSGDGVWRNEGVPVLVVGF